MATGALPSGGAGGSAIAPGTEYTDDATGLALPGGTFAYEATASTEDLGGWWDAAAGQLLLPAGLYFFNISWSVYPTPYSAVNFSLEMILTEGDSFYMEVKGSQSPRGAPSSLLMTIQATIAVPESTDVLLELYNGDSRTGTYGYNIAITKYT